MIRVLMLAAAMLYWHDAVLAQVLTNAGAVISITDSAVVQGDTIENLSGEILNQGTINLTGHFNNSALSGGNGFYNVAGNWRNTGTFNPGNSVVRLNGAGVQYIFNTGFGYFHKLIIDKPGVFPASRITLEDDIEVSNSLNMSSGIIETGENKLFLTSFLSSSLIYTSGHIIGKFERGINSADNYLFPLGSTQNYNPLNLDPNTVPSSGSVLSEFIAEDPDTLGLPIPDVYVEVYNVLTGGYWSLTANNAFSVANFNINMDGSGFDDPNPVQDITRVVKRPIGGLWTLDGSHADAVGNVAQRDSLTGNISSSGNQFALGNVRPLIIEEPIDTAVCDGTEATFSVVATGIDTLFYQWQEKGETGWKDILEGGIYSGTQTPTLTISSVNLDMDGFEYRVRISHKHGHVNRSRWALLTVNPLPVALATPQKDTLCNDGTTFISLSSDVPGTTYEWEVLYSGVITGASDGSTFADGDTIQHTLNNPGDYADSVIYRIVPTGPLTTYCEGHADTAVVYVNPTPRVVMTVVEDTICDSGTSTITVTSPTVLTSGAVMYNYTIESVSGNTGDVTGQQAYVAENLGSIQQTLNNHTDRYQVVTYRVHPYTAGSGSGVNCDFGNVRDTIFSIYVNPTPRIEITVVEDTICDDQTSTISVTSPTILTSGVVLFDLTVDDISAATGDVTGQQDLLDNALGSVDQTISNNTDVYQWVEYRVHPHTLGDGPGTTCGYGTVTDTLFRLYVNPTPSIEVLLSNDLITSDTTFCNNYEVLFDVNNYQGVIGTVKYHLEVTGDVDIINGETPSTDSLDITDFSNTLSQNDTLIRALNYRFIPYIENARGTVGCYSGIDTNVVVKVLPELHSVELPKILDPGGFNITCHGLSDGEIALVPKGGDLRFDYTIDWENEAGEQLQTSLAGSDLLDSLAAGIYSYDITDITGCFFTDTFLMTQPDTLSLVVDSILAQICSGFDASGAVFVTPSGGVDINKYTWYNKRAGIEIWYDEDLPAATPGSFRYTFWDAFGCEFDTTFRIEPAFPLASQILNRSGFTRYDVSCYGESDAYIEVTGIGGTGPNTYTYGWYDVNKDLISYDSLIRDLTAGTYYYTVEDANGCKTATDEDSLVAVQITQPDPMLFNMIDDTYAGGWNISCNGANDGIIRFDYSGGHHDTISYIYTWSTLDGTGLVQGDTAQQDLSPGIYSLSVIDEKGYCTADTMVILEEPDPIEYSYSVSEYTGGRNVRCFGSSDGAIYLDEITGGGPKDGEPEYAFFWEPPDGVVLDDSTVRNLENIPASGPDAYYVFTITDQNGCSVTDSVRLFEPEILRADTLVDRAGFKNGWAISCYGFDNGEIELLTEGGTAPYSYSWTGSGGAFADTNVVTDLFAGDYSVEITDQYGCTVTGDTVITEPGKITLNIIEEDPSCTYMEDGSIEVTALFGNPYPTSPTYDYNWDGPVEDLQGANIEDLPQGDYLLEVTDWNGCSVDTLISLVAPSPIEVEYEVAPTECADETNGSVTLTSVIGGTPPYVINDEFEQYYFDNLGVGPFVIVVEDNNLCVWSDTVEIIPVRISCLDIPNAFTPNGDGANDVWRLDHDEDGSNDMYLYPDAELTIFNRWGEVVYFTDDVLNEPWDGTYRGRDLPIDTYHYVLDLGNGETPIRGNVTIIRDNRR